MVMTKGDLGRAVFPGLNRMFGMSYKEHPEQYSRIFDVKKSNMNHEIDVSYSPFLLAQEQPETMGVHYDSSSKAHEKIYQHAAYGLGYIVSRQSIDDNLYAQIAADRTKALANSMRKTRETVAANVLNRAFNSNYVGADGIELCATTHVQSRGGTQSNTQDSASDLSENSLEQALIQIRQYKNGAGLPIDAREECLILPVALKYDAERILKNSMRPATADRDINAMVMSGDFPKGMVINNYLTDSDAYFIKTDVPNGLTFFERIALEFKQDQDFDTDNMKFKAYDRYSVGWTDYLGVWGSPGA